MVEIFRDCYGHSEVQLGDQLNMTFNQVECPASEGTCGRMGRKVKLGIRLLINCLVRKPGPLAQLAEQVTLNHPVAGSSPARLTILFSPLVFSFPTTGTFVVPLLKNQSDHAWPAGFLLSPTRLQGYNIVCGDGEETACAALLEYVVEVLP